MIVPKKFRNSKEYILSAGQTLRNTLIAVKVKVRNKVCLISARLPEAVVNDPPLAANLSATSRNDNNRIPKKQKTENSGNRGYISMFVVKASASISKSALASATLEEDDQVLPPPVPPDKRKDRETGTENPTSSGENSDVVSDAPSIPSNINLVSKRPDAAPAISQNSVRNGDGSNTAPSISQNIVRNDDTLNAAPPRLYY